jgi:orotate phosphoribosyltransferase-like protein
MKNKDSYERRMYVHNLRTKGLLFKEIAQILNVSDNRARQIYETAKRIKENEQIR